MALYAMIPLGAGQIIGSWIIGLLIDKRGVKVAIFFSLINFSIAMALLLWYTIVF